MTRRRPLAAALAVAIAGIGTGALTGASSASGAGRESPADRPGAPAVAPLDSSLAGAGATWADLAMGRLGQLTDRFWELFVLRSPSGRWSLVTPPGVADNGGLVSTAAAGSPLLAGFETSLKLGFSPLASSVSEGRSWRAGLLPRGLAQVPDAIAISRDRVLALLGGGSVVAGDGGLATWSDLVSARALAAQVPGRRCGISRLTAVAFSAAGSPLLGASCTASGTIGLFAQVRGGWRLVDVALPAGAVEGPTTVLRVGDAGHGPRALVAMNRAGRTALFVAGPESSGAAAWAASRPLELGAGARVVSCALTSSGGAFVLFTSGSSLHAEAVAGPGARWTPLPQPPAGTATLAFSAGGRVDALGVDGVKMTDYVLGRTAASWTRAQQLLVPLQYGSSG